ncbi:MAG TPA: lipoprotein insertase outer membrane protein LolB [Gammaproteobacteria bacterium]|nr:lipoprotein insertase outer membrane protein LolB [Gammaproteobacteria bacterium]
MTRRRGGAIAAVAAAGAALLAGCAHVAVEPQRDGLSFTERQMRLESIPAWRMRGRLAVSTDKGGFQGGFLWAQAGDRIDVSVRGPLGANVLEVSGFPDKLTVTARGEQRVLDDPERDLSELLGWWMPVESLPEWLLGLPDPGFPSDLHFARNGSTLESLDQRLWHVVFEEYRLQGGLLVPRKIELSHAGLELKLTVDTWQAMESATRALN